MSKGFKVTMGSIAYFLLSSAVPAVLPRLPQDAVLLSLWSLVPLWWLSIALRAGNRRLRRRRARSLPFEFGRGGRFEVAASRLLPDGESLIGFVPAFEAIYNPKNKWSYSFYGLGLTTVGLRVWTFAQAKERVGRMSSVRVFTESIIGERVVRHSEVVSVQSTLKYVPDHRLVATAMEQGFRASLPDVARLGRLAATGLTWTTIDGRETTLYSPFVEMATLIDNLNRLRSGEFLAARVVGTTDALGRLRQMVLDGVLSEDESDRLKAGFVGSNVERQESTEARIRQMYQLMKDGILTESEFRQKKWDILSLP